MEIELLTKDKGYSLSKDNTTYFVRILHQKLTQECGLSVEEINNVADAEQLELDRRQRLYCGDKAVRNYRGWQAIVADDGIATGATLEAAIEALRLRGVRSGYDGTATDFVSNIARIRDSSIHQHPPLPW